MGHKSRDPQHGSPHTIGDDANSESANSTSHPWRSLEEWAGSEEFKNYLNREFPEQAATWHEGSSRRDFLKLMAASLAFAGAYGCSRRPAEMIVPYTRQPEQIVLGKPLYYATAMEQHGSAIGLLVETHEGRPTKIEGNPNHPGVPSSAWGGETQAGPGATDAFAQASILELYDPDRSQTVMRQQQIATWDAFLSAVKIQLDAQSARQGSGLRVLTQGVVSPTMNRQLRELLTSYPQAKWHQYDPCHSDNAVAGARMAFGRDVVPIYHLDRADVILSFDADFLVSGPGHLRYARDFATRRQVSPSRVATARMSRLYVVESTPTLTGARADHRLPMSPRQIDQLARALARRLEITLTGTTGNEEAAEDLPADVDQWLNAVVDDLRNYRLSENSGASLILAGPWQPPLVHALVHAMNRQLGNVGTTVDYIEPVESNPVEHGPSIAELVDDMRSDRVEMLFILGGNPAFDAPADLRFADALESVPFRVHLSLYEDETSARCHWHVPATHYLESWSDTRAYDGTASIIQPMIDPLYDNVSPHELLAALTGQPGQSAFDSVRQTWRARQGTDGKPFEDWWQTALHNGVIADSAAPVVQVDAVSTLELPTSIASRDSSYDVIFRPDPTIDDGRFANNGWLQELPKPLTKLTWDNAALISPQLANQLDVRNGDLLRITRDNRSVQMPVWILPGQPSRAVTVHFGYGRRRSGRVGNKTGFNAFPLRTRGAMWFAGDATIQPTGDSYPLATTQNHWLIEGRHLVRSGTLDQWKADPDHPEFAQSPHHIPETSFYPEYEYNGYKWGMAIDLGKCTGCNACVMACQSENNIPIVGKQQVMVGRAMHWLRIDRYYEGGLENPTTLHQPVACMHCELAPCEVVCPVQATVHGDEGLNEMVYNRCVGTRYCANNCPYKVRRFNYLQYSDVETPVLALLANPNVTVRNRGVMEKCTYCVQRINAGRITAEKQDRRIRDGEVVTACQAVCPSQAIIFGDLNDPDSQIKQHKEQPLDYQLLDELNTRPRTSYSAAVTNPNPKLA